MPRKPTNPAAQLAAMRWSGTTPEQRKEHSDAMIAARKRSGPLPGPRCPCGKMSLNRAAKRNHRC